MTFTFCSIGYTLRAYVCKVTNRRVGKCEHYKKNVLCTLQLNTYTNNVQFFLVIRIQVIGTSTAKRLLLLIIYGACPENCWTGKIHRCAGFHNLGVTRLFWIARNSEKRQNLQKMVRTSFIFCTVATSLSF